MKLINIIAIIILVLYSFLFFTKTNLKKGRKKKLRKYIKVVLGFILLIATINVLVLIGGNMKKTNGDITTKVKEDNKSVEATTEEITTTEETTTSTTTVTTTKQATTTKSSSGTYKKISYDLSGATDKGSTSKGYQILEKNGITYIDGYMIANKTYGLPESFNPGKLDKVVSDAAAKMYAAAKKEKGYNMWGQSQFRSYQTQKSIYDKYVARDGKTAADTYSARPGYSEHQTGLAFDVCSDSQPCITSGFNNTPQAKWLSANAWKYGFILRYVDGKTNETGYKYESWHFRYVGSELAEKLYNNGDWITMESYFGFDSKYKD